MLKVSLHDRLLATPRADGQMTLAIRRAAEGISPDIPTGPDNLVLRAASELQHHAGVRFGADIILEKRIPAEAGLAGGSGNAAASLLALNRLWRLGLSRGELLPLAARLGSDIPFFLDPASAAVARGRGERIAPVPVRGPLHFVIVKPSFGLSTADVYRAYHEHPTSRRQEAAPVIQALARGNTAALGRALENALMPAAESLRPELKVLRKHIETICPTGTLMTGSGSAIFGLCATARHAARAAKHIKAINRMRAVAVTSI